MVLRQALTGLRLPSNAWLVPFDALSVDRLYAAMALRQIVFVVEQACVYLDADGKDRHALHLGFDDASAPNGLAAYARMFLPTADQPFSVFGRVITAPTHRKAGLGHRLVATCNACLDALAPGVETHIAAQLYLERFYAGHGFTSVGTPYLEDDIPHIDMVRPPR